MVEIFYVDTCIYLNAWRKEENGGILYWEIAENFFKNISQNGSLIYYSEYVLKELKSLLKEEDFKRKLNLFETQENFREVQLEKEDKNFAREIEMELNYELGFYDIIHILLAKKICAILITRDRRLLEIARKYGLEAKKPEEVR